MSVIAMTKTRPTLNAARFRCLAALSMLSLLPLGGCLDLKPAAAPPIRWLTIPIADESPSEMPAPAQPVLRLGNVESAAAIDDRLMRRQTAFEVRYAEGARWVNPPASLVRSAVEDELFRRRGFTSSTAADRVLDLEVVTFEEQFMPRHEARVAVIARWTLADGVTVVDRRLTGREPITGDDVALVARSMAQAIESVVTQLSDLIAPIE